MTAWMKLSIEALHMILCEEMTHAVTRKNVCFFQFLGHNVAINCSKLYQYKKTKWPGCELSIETLHMIICEEMTQLQGKTSAFFSFWIITSPQIARNS